MPFTYDLPIPNLDDGGRERTLRLEKWLLTEGAMVHRGSAIAVISVSRARYVILANGEGFLKKRLVRQGGAISDSAPLATIAADGVNIPYGKQYVVARRIANGNHRHRRRRSLAFRFWKAFKRFMTVPIHPAHSKKGLRQGFIARIVFLLAALVVGLYFEVPVLWWFLVAAVACGVLIAVAMRWFRDQETQ